MANKAIDDLLKYGARLVDYVQPTLSSNGTVGGSSFAVTGYASQQQGNFYMAVDGNAGTRWLGYHIGCYITLYTPVPVRCSQIFFETSDQAINGLSYLGSNNNSDFTSVYSGYTQTANSKNYRSITTENQNFYQYHKFLLTAETCLALWEISLVGKYITRN